MKLNVKTKSYIELNKRIDSKRIWMEKKEQHPNQRLVYNSRLRRNSILEMKKNLIFTFSSCFLQQFRYLHRSFFVQKSYALDFFFVSKTSITVFVCPEKNVCNCEKNVWSFDALFFLFQNCVKNVWTWNSLEFSWKKWQNSSNSNLYAIY